MELWLLYAVGAAIFAAMTTIFAKIGIKDVNSHLATAIRTMVVLVFAWLMVFIVGSQAEILQLSGRTWLFLILSGLATGASWLCFFRALQRGRVNKVVPIDKSSTILTMTLAFIFLGEPLGLFTVIGMILMGIGTWLMIGRVSRQAIPHNTNKDWLLYAILAAVFASLVAIIGRIGVVDMDATLWTAIRTVVVVPMSWLMVYLSGSQMTIKTVSRKSWLFLILSGVATGGSWLFFYHALQQGNAAHVVPIDRMSVLFTMAFAWLFLKEKFSRRSLIGLALLTAGTALSVFI